MSKGLYAQFGSLEELRSAVSRHLTSLAREIREKATLDKDSGPTEPRARDAWSGLRPLAAVQAVVTIVWKDERHLSNSNNMDYSVLDCDTHAARVRSLGSGRETSIPLGEVSLSQDPKRGNRPKLTLEKWIEEYAI